MVCGLSISSLRQKKSHQVLPTPARRLMQGGITVVITTIYGLVLKQPFHFRHRTISASLDHKAWRHKCALCHFLSSPIKPVSSGVVICKIYVVIWDGKTPSPSGEHFSIAGCLSHRLVCLIFVLNSTWCLAYSIGFHP